MWERTFRFTGNDIGHSVQVTKDGGYIITGYTQSTGDNEDDVYLVKTDSDGNLLWEKTFGGTGYDIGHSVQVTKDGGYIITGGTTSFGAGKSDVYLVKTDSDGNLEWEKTFGGLSNEIGKSVQLTNDGGYILTGGNERSGPGKSYVYLVKTDSDGNLEWEKTFGSSKEPEVGESVQVTKDGGYIITGGTSSFGTYETVGGSNVYLVKTDSDGNLMWEKVFGGIYEDYSFSVQVTNDGGYIITGFTQLSEDSEDVYLIKTDSDGNLEWEKNFGGSKDEFGVSVQITDDNEYIITGTTGSSEVRGLYVYLVKTDSDGNLLWEKTFGDTDENYGRSVQVTNEGGYIIVGYTMSSGTRKQDVYLVNTDSEGNSGVSEIDGNGGGIPSFPLLSIEVALILASLVLYMKQQR